MLFRKNRMRRYIRLCALLCLFTAVLPVMSVLAQSDAPVESYTHLETPSGGKKTVPMRAVYTPKQVMDIRSIGIDEGIEKITDIDCDDEGTLYVLSSDGKLFTVGAEATLKKEITVTDPNGVEMDLTGACGVLAESADEIYLADTENQRVLQIDGEGHIVNTIVRPESDLLPEDFRFAPVKIERDSKGVLYVLCDGAYYGALLFSPKGEFTGFYGANTVGGSALTTLAYIWDSLTKNDVKRSKAVKKLPYQFLDLYVDQDDFVYTCTGRTTDGTSKGQIKKLSPSGSNILYRQRADGTKTDAGSFNFGEAVTVKRNNKNVVQNFISIQTDERGYIYVLDNTFGLIYIYDTDCNLITAFGGGNNSGIQAGVFSSPIAMVYNNGRLYIADEELNSITVFERTEYGETLLSAQKKTLSADYSGAKEEWETVLREDSGSRLAMRGLAKAYYREGDYKTALSYAEDGLDYVTYGQALEKLHGDYLTKNFWWIFLVVLAVIGVITAFAVITVKKQVVLIRNERVRILLRAPIHPFESFQAIRYKNMGSMAVAVCMTALYYISSVAAETLSNFRFTTFDESNSSAFFQFLRTVGLILLFALANWLVCVLMEGKGTLKTVYTVVSYAVLPMVVYNIVATVLSHLITSPTNVLLSGLSLIAMSLTGIILAVGLIVIHEYSFLKLIGSLALTLFAMLLIVFIIFMVGTLLSQFWSFAVTVFMEAVYR